VLLMSAPYAAVGLPDTDQLGLTPATANDETGPDDPPVADQA
jgi:hypothetical protein